MKKLNRKGFTLVEVIAAVVILSVLMLLLVPSVNSLLQRGKNNSYKDLKQSFLLAAEEYVNDNRYNISVFESDITAIGTDSITDGKIIIGTLLEKGYLTPSGTDDSGEYIADPRDKSKRLNLISSYVKVNFNNRKFSFAVEDGYLSWN